MLGTVVYLLADKAGVSPTDILSNKGKSPGLTTDRNTGREVGRFIADEKGNVMIEPVGGKTVSLTLP